MRGGLDAESALLGKESGVGAAHIQEVDRVLIFTCVTLQTALWSVVHHIIISITIRQRSVV